MRFWRLTLLPLVLVACTEQPAAPDLEAGPTMSAVTGQILWYRHPFRAFWGRDVMLLGYEPTDDEWCNDGVYVGGIPVKEHYTVTHPAEDFDPWKLSTWGKGEGLHDVVTTIGAPPMYAYRVSETPWDGTLEELCTFLNEGYFAKGTWTGKIGNDNDLTGADETPGMNVWGGTERGTLKGNDGSLYRYENKYQIRFEPLRDVFEVMVDRWDFVQVK